MMNTTIWQHRIRRSTPMRLFNTIARRNQYGHVHDNIGAAGTQNIGSCTSVGHDTTHSKCGVWCEQVSNVGRKVLRMPKQGLFVGATSIHIATRQL